MQGSRFRYTFPNRNVVIYLDVHEEISLNFQLVNNVHERLIN